MLIICLILNLYSLFHCIYNIEQPFIDVFQFEGLRNEGSLRWPLWYSKRPSKMRTMPKMSSRRPVQMCATFHVLR